MSSRTKNSINNLITGVFGQLLVITLKFVARTVFISVLGKAYLGINGLFADILSMLSLTELGLDTAINFKLYKPLAEKDEERVRVLMRFYRIAYTVVGFVILLLGLCLIPFLPHLIHDFDSLENLGINAAFIFLLYLMQSVSSYLFFAYRSAIVKADQKEYLLNIAGYVVTIATNITQIAVLWFFHSFILYTASIVVFNIIQNCVNAKIAKHHYGYAFKKGKNHISVEEVKDIFKDLMALFIYKVNNVVVKATDNMVLSTFIGLEIVGMYSNYLMFYTAINAILNRLYSAIKASMGNLYATGTEDQKYRFFEIMNFLSAILYGTACIGIAVVANELIQCWIGKDYTIAQPFPILMGIEILFLGLKYNLGQIRNVSGIFRQMWFRPVIGIIVNLVVSVLLVQKISIYGVLIGTIVSSIVANFMVDPPVIFKYTFNDRWPVSVYYLKNITYMMVLLVVGVVDNLICSHVYVGHGWTSALVHILICSLSVPGTFALIFHKRHEYIYLVGKVKSLSIKIKAKFR